MPLETDKNGGFKLSLDGINTGVHPDLFSRKIPLWETGENVRATEVGVERIKGRVKLADTGAGSPIRGLVQTTRSGNPAVYFGDLTALWSYVEGSGVTDVSGTSTFALNGQAAGINDASHWSMQEFGNFIIAAADTAHPQVNKTGDFEEIQGLGIVTEARIAAVMGPHVLLFNTDCSDREFIWCDADNVDVWEAAADNLAGQLEIRELQTEIKAVVPIGSRLAVYGGDQMFLINYLNNDLVFGYQSALNGIGAVSPSSVIPVGRRNFGLTKQGFFVTDGASFEYIDDPAVRHWFRNNINQLQLSQVVGFHNEEATQVQWYFRRAGDAGLYNSYGITYNYEKGSWGFLSGRFSYTACQERTVFQNAIVADESGVLWKDSEGTEDDDGVTQTPIAYSLLSKGLDLGDADRVKELSSIRIGMRGQGLDFDIGWADTEDGTPTWVHNFTDVDASNGFAEFNVRTAGRWLFLRFQGVNEDADWEVMSIEIIGRTEGSR